MTSAGDTLRRERLKQNFDLDHISEELKISRRMLDAIEADQYDKLPGAVFAKAFVRQYATLLGLDAEELGSRVHLTVEPQVPQFVERPRHAEPVALAKVAEWQRVSDGSRISGWTAAVLFIGALLISSAVYAWINRPRVAAVTASSQAPSAVVKQEPATTAPAEPQAAPPTVSPTPGPVPVASEAQPVAPPPTQPTQAPPSAQPAATAPSTPGPVHVEIAADAVAWMLVRVDGKFAYTGTMEPGTRRTFDGATNVYIRLGDAGAVTVLLNGKPVGALGPKGQVREVQFTSGGFQIVPSKPAAALPLDPLDRL
jgi:cytoskeleton protein RodZ